MAPLSEALKDRRKSCFPSRPAFCSGRDLWCEAHIHPSTKLARIAAEAIFPVLRER